MRLALPVDASPKSQTGPSEPVYVNLVDPCIITLLDNEPLFVCNENCFCCCIQVINFIVLIFIIYFTFKNCPVIVIFRILERFAYNLYYNLSPLGHTKNSVRRYIKPDIHSCVREMACHSFIRTLVRFMCLLLSCMHIW